MTLRRHRVGISRLTVIKEKESQDMNRSIVSFLALIIILSVSPAMSWADEKARGGDIGKTTWKDIFSDVVGHYPLYVYSMKL